MPLPSGTTFIDIDLTQVDKKSPVDDDLMESIAEDLYFLKNQTSAIGGLFDWNLNGDLSVLADILPFRRFDGGRVGNVDRTLTTHKLVLELPGTDGTLEADIRKYRVTNTPIMEILHQYTAAPTSITRVGTSINTQSISRATAQVATQSVSRYKATINITSIIPIGGGLTRYNLASAPDADWVISTDYVQISSATTGSNNGTFRLIRKNDDSGFNVILQNASGVLQTGAAGTAGLQAWQYILLNPADAQFVVGEKALFAGHTSALNDGSFEIYLTNAGADNIVVKNRVGLDQAGVAGTVDTYRFTYVYGSAVAADYVVGETAFFAAHTSTANDGHLPIRGVNVSGNNLIVYNEAGVTQGGVAGTADTDRWIYALPTDPTSSFTVGQTFYYSGATNFNNDGIFEVKQINRSAVNNLVVYNIAGVTQAGTGGTLYHTRKLLRFAADESAIYSTLSRVNVRGTAKSINFGEYDVLQVNRGGGANYNIVVDIPKGIAQELESGQIEFESRSIFSVRPTITVLDKIASSSNGTLHTTEKLVESGRILMPELLQVPLGNPENLTVSVL